MHHFSTLEVQPAVEQLLHQVITAQRSRRTCSIHRSSIAYDCCSKSRNSTPIPMRGFTTRTTPSASTFCSLRVNVTRTRDFIFSGLLVHTKQPPSDTSDVTPSVLPPVSKSISEASAANGNRIAYLRSRTERPLWPPLGKCSSMEITFFTVLGPCQSELNFPIVFQFLLPAIFPDSCTPPRTFHKTYA